MVRLGIVLLKDGISNTHSLSHMLVCPLSKQPLRVCDVSNSLISNAIGVSFPILNGIPCLMPKDGKLINAEDMLEEDKDVGTPDQEGTSK